MNAGIYHERNMGEPAFASLMQQDIGANPKEAGQAHRGTFSFDLSNSACGVLNAVHIVDGFLGSHAIDVGMVVASDCDPRTERVEDPIPARGGAVLLSRDATVGFTAFDFATFPDDEELRVARVGWTPRTDDSWLRRSHGSNTLTITSARDYTRRCVEHAAFVVRRFLTRNSLDIGAIDLIVASHTSPDFAVLLAEDLDHPRGRLFAPDGPDAGAHSTGLLIALDNALRADAFRPGSTVLFAVAGAGITVGLALYQA